jgi:predicted nucleotidyltransferase
MDAKSPNEIIYNKTPLQILSYLTKHKTNGFIYGAKIAEVLEISQGGASTILKQFKELGILSSENVGKTIKFNVNWGNPIIKSFRVFDNLLEINSLVEEIKHMCRKIILFGSCATGDDSLESDIDLFVLVDGDNVDKVRSIISLYKIEREIKPLLVDTLELTDMEQNDKVFIEEVNKGIVLWGGKSE